MVLFWEGRIWAISYLSLLLFHCYHDSGVFGLNPSVSQSSVSAIRADCLTSLKDKASPTNPVSFAFSAPLTKIRPQAQTASEVFWSLWNDKRSITSLIRDNRENDDHDHDNDEADFSSVGSVVPYCIVSDPFVLSLDKSSSEDFSFQVLLYPRGVTSSTDQPLQGTPASAYLLYNPSKVGDEVDVAWKMRLVDDTTGKSLSIETSGGLPKSKDTWSAAMTFCDPTEAVDSLGRTSDWGSSTWNSQQVCEALVGGQLRAEGEISLFATRRGETSFQVPPKGAIAAAQSTMSMGGKSDGRRDFRAGEIIVVVPNNTGSNPSQSKRLQDMGVYSGVDYRVMTLADPQGQPIFSTHHLSDAEHTRARLALRPVGWKLQQRLWETRGRKEWPVEVECQELLGSSAEDRDNDIPVVGVLSRFNVGAFVPRFRAFLQQDLPAVVFALTVAVAPIPTALVAREFFSLYAIPSASMDPTLQRGDLLLVEKFPGILDRTNRGDIILFKPPSRLLEIVNGGGGGSNKIGKDQLFVKRLVGLPGDQDIHMVAETQEVTVNGQAALGPNRNLCADEPLRLMDQLLDQYGYGIDWKELGPDEAYVLGDCKAVSVDSRVFGSLPTSNIVGRPLARLWPLDRIQLGPLE